MIGQGEPRVSTEDTPTSRLAVTPPVMMTLGVLAMASLRKQDEKEKQHASSAS